MSPRPVASEVSTADGSRARLVTQAPGDSATDLLGALDVGRGSPAPVLLVCGGADELQGAELESARAVLGPAVASAAALTGAVVIDGGTDTGVMALTGMARARDPDGLATLIGVAPAGTVAHEGHDGMALEPHHTDFVLADADTWGGETELMFDLAGAVAGEAPVALVLAGGGNVARAETIEAVRRGWPVFALQGTGGAAAEIAAAYTAHHHRPMRRRDRWRLRGMRTSAPELSAIADPGLREIVAAGDVRCFSGSEPGQLARQLAWQLQDEPVLKDAWQTFAGYDAVAGRQRTRYERFQKWILALGVLATLLALLSTATGWAPLHWTAVATPIALSSVIALANRRASGRHWVLLRAAAESIKAEIYRYRAHAGLYADTRMPAGRPQARAGVLAQQLNVIEQKLTQTEASGGSLDPYAGPLPPVMWGAARDDDGLSALNAEQYLRIRVGDQLSYFRGRVAQLDRRRARLHVVAVFAGGAGALLVAAGAAVWVGLTTTVSGAALAYLSYLQVDNTIVAYNQAAAKLHGLGRDWSASRPTAEDLEAFDRLVNGGEAVLGTELGGWVAQMTQAVDHQQSGHDGATPPANGGVAAGVTPAGEEDAGG